MPEFRVSFSTKKATKLACYFEAGAAQLDGLGGLYDQLGRDECPCSLVGASRCSCDGLIRNPNLSADRLTKDCISLGWNTQVAAPLTTKSTRRRPSQPE
jgi:ferredoxin-thioredoxin reductase catalytic subunit